MLEWKKIAENFVFINVGKEYNQGPYYWTTFYYYKGLIVDSGCPHTAEESASFIEEMTLDVRIMMKEAASRLETWFEKGA